ncbi:MAG: hypothetical protein ACI9AR_000592 [Flavobacteriaceae bacterium]|jgi:hypothetical protein
MYDTGALRKKIIDFFGEEQRPISLIFDLNALMELVEKSSETEVQEIQDQMILLLEESDTANNKYTSLMLLYEKTPKTLEAFVTKLELKIKNILLSVSNGIKEGTLSPSDDLYKWICEYISMYELVQIPKAFHQYLKDICVCLYQSIDKKK